MLLAAYCTVSRSSERILISDINKNDWKFNQYLYHRAVRVYHRLQDNITKVICIAIAKSATLLQVELKLQFAISYTHIKKGKPGCQTEARKTDRYRTHPSLSFLL
jgi:hypothetical protein